MHLALVDSNGIVLFESIYAPVGAMTHAFADLYRALGIGASERLLAEIRGLADLSQTNGLVPHQPDIGRAAATMERLLLPGDLPKRLSAYDLVVVAGYGGINVTPFAMLHSSNGQPFVESTAFVSASSLLEVLHEKSVKQKTPTQLGDAIVVGDPKPPDALAAEFPPLSGARAEARRVAALLGVEPILWDEATLPRVRRDAAGAGLIYIAAHAVASGESAEAALDDSYILLSDGPWSARQIQEDSFAARLVVLSGCETGLGFNHRGGVIGLARAFELAGVPRTLMSLWSVDDTATASLMLSFMQRRRDHPDAEALRLAMLHTREAYPHPRYWAGFSLFGSDFLIRE